MRKEIKQIEDNILKLNELRETLEEEAKRWLNERNRLSEQSKKLKEEVGELKKERNTLNQEVQRLKQKREELRKKVLENRDKGHAILNSLTNSKLQIPHNVLDLKAERDRLEWIMQTNPLSREKEQQLMEQIKNMETKRVRYNRVNDLKNEIIKRRTEIDSLKLQMESSYEEQAELSRKSDTCHNEMLQLYSKAEEFRKGSDQAHKNYKECLARSRKKESINYALEKFKKGKKVTLEEFKIIFENGKFLED